MYQGQSLTALATELERQSKAKHDVIVDTKRLTIQHRPPRPNGHRVDGIWEADPVTASTLPAEAPIVELTVPQSGTYQIGDTAHGQLATWTGIGQRYYKRMKAEAPDLLLQNVRHWFKEQSAPRMVRTLDGNARAVLSNSYLRIDHYDLATQVIGSAIKMGSAVDSCAVTESKLYVKGTLPTVERELQPSRAQQVGDVLRFGWRLTNSEIGHGAATLSIFAVVLSCLNGMTFPREFAGVSRRHLGKRVKLSGAASLVLPSAETQRHEIEYFHSAVRDTLNQVMDPQYIDQIVGSLNQTTQREIEGDVPGAVQVLRKEYGLSEVEGSGILSHLIRGGDLSQWGLIQATTRTAADADNYDRASELEAIGGKMSEMPARAWARIATAEPVRA